MSTAQFAVYSAAAAAMTEHIRGATTAAGRLDLAALLRIEAVLRAARAEGRRVFTLGNGGSAAAAMHLATDLALLPAPYDVVCLNGNGAMVSALANDHGYDQIFARQLAAQATAGDVVVAISASGNSANCINAVSQARASGATPIALVGFDGGALLTMTDEALHVAAHDYRVVEDVHAIACHALAAALAR